MVDMPKSKPTQVIVHRIELQEKERDMLESIVVTKSISNMLIPTAAIAGVGIAGYIGYKAANAFFDWGEDIVDGVQDLLNTDVGIGESPVPIIEAVLGKKKYTDKSGQTFTNPLAGIPVLGSLFGSGINIGIATNPKFWGDDEEKTGGGGGDF
jgi:hypothetical protein